MADTTDLAAIYEHLRAAGGKLLLVGDHHQLAAIGAGGMMELLANSGTSYELATAHRFEPGERDASRRLRAADQTVLGEYHKHGRLRDGGAVEQAKTSAACGWLADTLAGRHSLLLVDTNEQAARLSAQLRADLVRLGYVAEQGVPLGLQGTYAGLGDLVQARLNGWHLAGYEGNRRGPINREHYRVLDARDDGSLVVAPLIGRAPDGEMLGERMTLPAEYVAEHVALGYASTVHAAQGLTVDTAHAVITPRTSPEALYVGMSRGSTANTAHVITRTVPVDAPTGTVNEAVHRNPVAVLAGVLETADPQRSALAVAAESAHDNASVRTSVEVLAVAAEIVTAGRTAGWLDQLVDDGRLTAEQRAQIAAEDGGPTLARALRRAELAGHDAHRVLVDAVTERSLHGSRQVTNMIHHRIASNVSLDPVGDSYADRIPQGDDAEWRYYLTTLAAAADSRRDHLVQEVAAQPPQWAIEALGPVPADLADREAWERRAGVVAAHRELSGHDDPSTALGPAPKPGQVEEYASWRTAWRALGRPEADRDELEMSNGQLRMRTRAAEREATWGPRYVANELAGTRQAAETHRQAAAVRAADAANAGENDARARLQREATEAAALADVLDHRVEQLQQVDDARAMWLAHTAATRAAADRAEVELSARHVDDPRPEQLVTAEEWLAEHDAAMRAEDPHREITDEAELVETVEVPEAEAAAAAPAEHAEPHVVDDAKAIEIDEEPAAEVRAAAGEAQAADRVPDRNVIDDAPVPEVEPPAADDGPGVSETNVRDIREVAADEPVEVHEDEVRVPAADETADAIHRAQRALAEIQQREAAEEQRAAEEARAEQLTRWHADDQSAEQLREQAAERETPPLERTALDE